MKELPKPLKNAGPQSSRKSKGKGYEGIVNEISPKGRNLPLHMIEAIVVLRQHRQCPQGGENGGESVASVAHVCDQRAAHAAQEWRRKEGVGQLKIVGKLEISWSFTKGHWLKGFGPRDIHLYL